jgi:aminocarboxymuconate-semialdehyde decarboxylase
MMDGAIDIHTHIVPADFPAYAGRGSGDRWPRMAAGHDCHHRSVMIDGNLFRTITDECWDTERRLDAMRSAGISRQVLSPMPELLSYWFDPDDAVAFGQHVNDTLAGMVVRAPDHFSALGMIPLQDPQLACGVLERLMASGTFAGVEIGTNVNGVPIGDPKFEPFFATAEQLGAAIFVHALHPAGQDRITGSPKLTNFVGFPCENAFAIASLITGGILRRHPGLRIACSHGGGAFALLLPRMEKGCGIAPDLAEAIGVPPRELARRLFYDTLVYDVATLRFLIDTFGVEQLCIGTDFPFDIHEQAPLDPIRALGGDEQQSWLLRTGNALRFLGGRTAGN